MSAHLWGREFRLAPDGDLEGVSCDTAGTFIGPVPLLRRARNTEGVEVWTPRSEIELNAELSVCYGLPVDIALKTGGLATVARALNAGNLALARIAAVQLQFPDPPLSAKGARSIEDTAKLAVELYWSGLLKGDWDPDKHPRTGEKPNPGWFAEVPKEPKPPAPGWPSASVNRQIREIVKNASKEFARTGRLVVEGVPVIDAIMTFLEGMSPTELNRGEDRMIAQTKAYFDPPKTLDELRSPPTENAAGYERHHIVEQNPNNIAKNDIQKFGRERIEDPGNIVWIPRLKHEEISAEYNSADSKDSRKRRKRIVVNEMDFEAQRQAGLEVLREKGVLK